MMAAGTVLAVVLVVVGVTSLDVPSEAQQPTALDVPNEAQQPTAQPGGNVVFLLVDTLRPDHLGCYGYDRPTSPYIDAVAREGAVFEQAFSPGSYTGEIISSFFSGVLPSMNPAGTGWYPIPDPNRQTLAQHFQQAGYRTGCFSDHVVLLDPGFKPGFDVYEVTTLNDHDQGVGPAVAKAATAFMEKAGGDPFYMYVHMIDPHGAYEPPDEFLARIDAPRYPAPLHVYNDVRPRAHELIAEGFGPGEVRFEDMIGRYDGEIAYTDDCVGTILRKLDELGLRENTTVVIAADHGEEFLEHRFVEHAWTLYNEVLHVPLIVRAPDRIEPQRIATRVSTIDLFPTLLELAGVAYQRNDLSGFALFHNEGGTWQFRQAAYPIVSELSIETRPMVRSVISGDYKLLQWRQYYAPEECESIGPREPELRDALRAGTLERAAPWDPVVREELYNLAEDPQEQHNLIETHPQRRQELARMLSTYERLARANDAGGGGETAHGLDTAQHPLPPVAIDPEIEEQMRALGYAR
jgi:arylsulfatase